MPDKRELYINGQWTDSIGGRLHTVINPATEQPVSEVMLGTAADVDAAVKAARAAFDGFSATSKEERLALLGRIIDGYKARIGDIAERRLADQPMPPHTLLYHIDMGTSMMTAYAVAVALLQRERTGEGQKIETSLLQTGVSLHAVQMTKVAAFEGRFPTTGAQTITITAPGVGTASTFGTSFTASATGGGSGNVVTISGVDVDVTADDRRVRFAARIRNVINLDRIDTDRFRKQRDRNVV